MNLNAGIVIQLIGTLFREVLLPFAEKLTKGFSS